MRGGRRSGRHPGGSIGSSSLTVLAPGGPQPWNTPDMTRLLTALFLVFVMACTADKAKDLLETAEFEERQMNIPHAKQLYEEVIRLYPSSQEAEKAKARLAKLSQT